MFPVWEAAADPDDEALDTAFDVGVAADEAGKDDCANTLNANSRKGMLIVECMVAVFRK